VQKLTREDGFTLVELLTSSVVTLLVLAGAVTTFQNAMKLNDAGQQLADSTHNLRSGANILIHDLMQAGRKIPTGGIPIPSGAGALNINRPTWPSGPAYTFNSINSSMLLTVTTGKNLGPTITSTTDMITFLMIDPLLGETNVRDATTSKCAPASYPNSAALLSTGASMNVAGTTSTSGWNWLTGDPTNGVAPIAVGDLVWFNTGNTAIRMVTSKDASNIFFDTGDWFNFNQTGAANGTLQKLRSGSPARFPCGFAAARLLMYTYYIDPGTATTPPRLMRVINNGTPQALAGVVEDMDFTYDLVDGSVNPVRIPSLPYTDTTPNPDLTYTATQARKVNIHLGVRSETISPETKDYLRAQVNTVVSLRNLAFTPFIP
jgi:Tfp pilus assembly protein PilW